MKNRIGYCGLDCEKCDAYIATITDNQVLREKTAALWANLNNAPILPEHINCDGCRENGTKTIFCEHLCEIRRCAKEKDIPTCIDCADFSTCRIIKGFLENNPSAFDNLKIIQQD